MYMTLTRADALTLTQELASLERSEERSECAFLGRYMYIQKIPHTHAIFLNKNNVRLLIDVWGFVKCSTRPSRIPLPRRLYMYEVVRLRACQCPLEAKRVLRQRH